MKLNVRHYSIVLILLLFPSFVYSGRKKEKLALEKSYVLLEEFRHNNRGLAQEYSQIKNELASLWNKIHGWEKSTKLKNAADLTLTKNTRSLHEVVISFLWEIEGLSKRYPFAKEVDSNKLYLIYPKTRAEHIGFRLAVFKEKLQKMKT